MSAPGTHAFRRRTVLISNCGGRMSVGEGVVVELLKDPNISVRVGLSDIDKVPPALKKLEDYANLHYIELNHNHPEKYEAAFEGVDAALLIPPFRADADSRMARLIDAAHRADHLVLFSYAMSDWMKENTRYGHVLNRIEEHVKRGNKPWTILRVAFLMENWLLQRNSIMDEKKLYGGIRPTAPYAVSSLHDVAVACREILTRPHEANFHNQTFLIAHPRTQTTEAIVKDFSQTLGQQVEYVHLETDEFKQFLMDKVGLDEWKANSYLEIIEDINSNHEKWRSNDWFHISKYAGAPKAPDHWIQEHVASFSSQSSPAH